MRILKKLCLALTAAAALTGAPAVSQSALNDILSNGVLKVGTTGDNPWTFLRRKTYSRTKPMLGDSCKKRLKLTIASVSDRAPGELTLCAA